MLRCPHTTSPYEGSLWTPQVLFEEEIGNQDESFFVDVETKFNEITEEELDNKRESNNDDVETYWRGAWKQRGQQ